MFLYKRLFSKASGVIRELLYILRVLGNQFSGKRKHTYCSWLWDTAFIDEHGNVTACCNGFPGNLGNINEDNLSRIIGKSKRLKSARWRSLHGCLRCFHDCSHLSKEDRESTITRKSSEEPDKWLHIQYTSFCNLNCKMCGQDHASRVRLADDILKRNIDWHTVDQVLFQGGEILALEEAKQFYLWLTQEKKKKVNVITNGVLINEEWAEHLVKGGNFIEISVNATTDDTYRIVNNSRAFSTVIRNIKRLITVKHKLGFDTLIRYHFTIIPENVTEIADAIIFADTLGCDIVTYCFDTSVPHYFEKHEDARKAIKENILKVIKQNDLKVKIRGQYLDQLGLLDETVPQSVIVYCV